MRALLLNNAEDASLEEMPEPAPGPGEVKVKVAWAGICGSDLALYKNLPVPHEYVHPLFGERGPHTGA